MKAQLARVLRSETPHLHLEPPPAPLPLQWLRDLPLAWLLVPLALAKLSAVVFGILDIDESDWSIAGRLLGQGILPYVGFVEKKPILSFVFYLPAAVVGYRQWVMQLLALAWIFATALLAGRAAKEWTRDDDAGRAAAWLYVLAACGGIPAVNAETMMNLPAAAALWWFVRAERSRRLRDAALVGALVAAASLFKHQAGILLVAFALTLAWEWLRRRSREAARMAALVCGFTLPWLAVAAIYWRLGHLAEFFEWNVLRNLGYAAHAACSSGETTARCTTARAGCPGPGTTRPASTSGTSTRRISLTGSTRARTSPSATSGRPSRTSPAAGRAGSWIPRRPACTTGTACRSPRWPSSTGTCANTTSWWHSPPAPVYTAADDRGGRGAPLRTGAARSLAGPLA